MDFLTGLVIGYLVSGIYWVWRAKKHYEGVSARCKIFGHSKKQYGHTVVNGVISCKRCESIIKVKDGKVVDSKEISY